MYVSVPKLIPLLRRPLIFRWFLNLWPLLLLFRLVATLLILILLWPLLLLFVSLLTTLLLTCLSGRLVACRLLPVVSLLLSLPLLPFLLLLLLRFLSAFSKACKLICPTSSTISGSTSFGFDEVTSTGSSSSGNTPCWFSDFIFCTLSIVSGYCLLLSGNVYHIRFLKISFLIRNAFPFATCNVSQLSGKCCNASK